MNGVQLLLIIVGGIAVSAFAHRRGAQPGLIVVVLAAGASFIPGVPRLELHSELILAVVVPPLLYSATRAASASGFSQNLRPILTLGVTLVVLTTGVAGFVGSWLMPSIGLPAALLLGAVLAPPDTITTVSHGDELGLPRRISAILTGESLVNDATALTLFGLAAAAAGAGETLFHNAFGLFAYTVTSGLLVGAAFAVAALWLRPRLHNPVLETSLALLLPFTAFLTAEQLHASGILAVVTAAFAFSINATLDPKHQYPGAYRTRLQEDAVWPVLDFLLETFMFAYIGLQLRFVIADLGHAAAQPGLAITLISAAVLLVTVILFRLGAVWLFFAWWGVRRRSLERKMATDPRLRARAEQRIEARNRRLSRRQQQYERNVSTAGHTVDAEAGRSSPAADGTQRDQAGTGGDGPAAGGAEPQQAGAVDGRREMATDGGAEGRPAGESGNRRADSRGRGSRENLDRGWWGRGSSEALDPDRRERGPREAFEHGRRGRGMDRRDRPSRLGQPTGEWRGPLGEPTPRESLIVGWTGMRGILTLAAAAAIPPTLRNGEEFPGRDAIQAIALFVTLGTLLIQGTTIPMLVRRLNIDTSGERRRVAELLEQGQAIAEEAVITHGGPLTAADFDAQRTAVTSAVIYGDLDDDTARVLVHDIDLRQAAATHLSRKKSA